VSEGRCYGAQVVRRAFAAVGFAALALVGGASAALLGDAGVPVPAGTSAASAPGAPVSSAAGSTTEPATPATTASTTTGTVTTSDAATTFVVSGHGYGHGMGMGQWGAYGYALHGWSDAQILRHYYPGTTLGHDAPRRVRVLLAEGVSTVTVGSAAPWQLTDAAGTKLRLPAGSLVVRAPLRLQGRRLVSPLTFRPGRSPVEAASLAYRGALVIDSTGRRLDLVNVVPLESYLDGVVAEEMPTTWPPAALEAQAIAARSYALAQIAAAATESPFDLYDDWRSQAYGGIAAETPTVARAVAATVGEIVLYDGKVAMTYFSSSSGGQTSSAAAGTGTPVPYLVSVPDPFDALSPDHDWGPLLFSAAGAGKKLGLDGPLVNLEVPPGSGHVPSVTAIAAGGQVTLTGLQVQSDLGLRSTWFQVGLLALKPRPAPVGAGTAVTLTGTVEGLSGVALEAEPKGQPWRTLAPVAPDSAGSFSIEVTPEVTTLYRLATGSVRGALIKVEVGGR
jgi:stage II sporulation protein D